MGRDEARTTRLKAEGLCPEKMGWGDCVERVVGRGMKERWS